MIKNIMFYVIVLICVNIFPVSTLSQVTLSNAAENVMIQEILLDDADMATDHLNQINDSQDNNTNVAEAVLKYCDLACNPRHFRQLESQIISTLKWYKEQGVRQLKSEKEENLFPSDSDIEY